MEDSDNAGKTPLPAADMGKLFQVRAIPFRPRGGCGILSA
jgi:hypothetical protein